MILDDYLRMMSSLNVKKTNGRLSPHKAILLLAVIDIIEFELTDGNHFYLDKETEDSYNYCWNQYIPDNYYWFKPNPWTPFWHLNQEPFWHFVAKAGKEDCIDNLVPKGNSASVGKMREVIEYARLDDELFALLKDEQSRTQIREVLIKNYLTDNTQAVGSSVGSKVNSDDVLFKKVLDWSMFNAGTTIPTQYHDAIQSVCDEFVPRGGSKHVTIVFEGIEYDAVLRSPDIKGRAAICLQFNWNRTSPIANALRAKYKDVYESILSQRIKAPGKKPFLPDNMKYSLAFCKSTEHNKYILLPIYKSINC